MVKNPPSNAGDMGLIPDEAMRLPHASGPLSLHDTAAGSTRLSAVLCIPRACMTQLRADAALDKIFLKRQT